MFISQCSLAQLSRFRFWRHLDGQPDIFAIWTLHSGPSSLKTRERTKYTRRARLGGRARKAEHDCFQLPRHNARYDVISWKNAKYWNLASQFLLTDKITTVGGRVSYELYSLIEIIVTKLKRSSIIISFFCSFNYKESVKGSLNKQWHSIVLDSNK